MQLNFTNVSLTPQHQNVQNIQFRPNPPQPAFLTPQKQQPNTQYFPNHIHQQSQKIMYKSTIQPFNAVNNQIQQNPSFGLGKLASMGRVIQQVDDQSNRFQEKTPVIHQQQTKPLVFRTDRPERAKMAASMMFFNHKGQEQNVNFPSFNNQTPIQNEPSKGFQSLMSKAKIVQQEIQPLQTPQDKRTRQIFEIKQQMDKLSNRIDSFRPKNTPAFVPSQQPQQVVPLTFVKNNSQKVQNTFQGNQANFNLNKNHSEQANYNTRVNSQQQSKFNSIQQPHNHGSANNGIQAKNNNEYQSSDLYKKISTLSTSTNASNENERPSLKQQNGMFKKKSAYVEPQSQQTNPNLLKMLGIKSPSNRQQAVSPNKLALFNAKPLQSSIQPQPYIPQPKRSQQKANKQTVPPKIITKNDFKIGKKMGKGQFGEVMLVQHKLTGFVCGMKVMSKKQIKSQKYQNQIARELSIQFYLQHRNIAPLYGYFQDEQNLYLLVQFCTDGQLLEMIRKNRRMQENEVSPIIREICEGLDYIHKQEIIHRDVKPENILFNFGTVKISDFGWAVHCGNGMRKTVSGSPLYYSPQIVLETQYDEKIDIWAIGMMAYECLLGKIPFRIYSEFDLNRIVQDEIKFPQYVDVTDQAKDFILRIMKKKPEERMQIKQILRHPFITKYLKQRRVAPQIIEQFRKILSL